MPAFLYNAPPSYLFQAGSCSYVVAANSFKADQLLFGSFYTFRSIEQSIQYVQELGLGRRFNG
jgi:hypothetical protein